MNKKTFVTTILMAAMAVTPVFVASAQEVSIPESSLVGPEVITVSPEQILLEELAELKIKEADPTTGSLTKWVIRFRIRQIENQLKIKEALQ